MPRRNAITFIIILIVFGFALWTVLPLDSVRFGRKGMHLGLDLVGGVQLVYQAQFGDNTTAEERSTDIGRALATIERRIDKYGVTEPIIQRLGTDRILVQLPGFTDIAEAKRLVEQTGFLEFRQTEMNENGDPVYLNDYLQGSRTEFFDSKEQGNRVFVNERGNPVAFLVKSAGELKLVDEAGNPTTVNTTSLKPAPNEILSWIPAKGNVGTPLTGTLLKSASPTIRQEVTGNEYQVSIEWNAQGSEIFDQVASRLYNAGPYGSPERALGIFLDNNLVSAPQILEQAYHGVAAITGGFTRDRAVELANLLNSGSLPMPLKKPPLFQDNVSETLGANFIGRSVKAGIIGTLLVMLFMIAYYRVPGALASLALVFYAALVLAIFKLWPVTLTLAGLGGFVLSIGMAVDANVLIFERMKEEFRAGRTLGAAIEAGFDRAWSAIRDSNITTFIACGILYWLGSSVIASAPVMGFALTLAVGVAASMFTAITVSRTLLRLFVGSNLSKKTNLFTAEWVKK